VGALQQMVIVAKFQLPYQLKRVLINCWAQLSQDTLNHAIDQLLKRLIIVIKAMGHYFFSVQLYTKRQF